MTKFKEKNKREICDEIDLIIADEDKKVEYKYIFVHLDNALANNKLWRDFNDL
jgi:hypothetical protein